MRSLTDGARMPSAFHKPAVNGELGPYFPRSRFWGWLLLATLSPFSSSCIQPSRSGFPITVSVRSFRKSKAGEDWSARRRVVQTGCDSLSATEQNEGLSIGSQMSICAWQLD